MPADLHVHTVYSDGTVSPAEVVQAAAEGGLIAVGIADHDSIGGVPEAMEESKRAGIEAVPGVEINAEENGREIHVLGYYLREWGEEAERSIAWLRENRLERLQRFIVKLGRTGVTVREEEVLAEAGVGSVGRPHIARVLARHGFARDVGDAFVRYLSPGAPTYVPREHVPVARAIDWVRKLGGLPVLAHPGKLGNKGLVTELLQQGFVGIEAYHPDHTAEDVQWLTRLAAVRSLLVTGGTDSHGTGTLRCVPVGAVTVSDQEFLRLKEAALARVST